MIDESCRCCFRASDKACRFSQRVMALAGKVASNESMVKVAGPLQGGGADRIADLQNRDSGDSSRHQPEEAVSAGCGYRHANWLSQTKRLRKRA